jgi:hypothetical protein
MKTLYDRYQKYLSPGITKYVVCLVSMIIGKREFGCLIPFKENESGKIYPLR